MAQLFVRIPQYISLTTNSTKLSFILFEIINDNRIVENTALVQSNQIKLKQLISLICYFIRRDGKMITCSRRLASGERREKKCDASEFVCIFICRSPENEKKEENNK